MTHDLTVRAILALERIARQAAENYGQTITKAPNVGTSPHDLSLRAVEALEFIADAVAPLPKADPAAKPIVPVLEPELQAAVDRARVAAGVPPLAIVPPTDAAPGEPPPPYPVVPASPGLVPEPPVRQAFGQTSPMATGAASPAAPVRRPAAPEVVGFIAPPIAPSGRPSAADIGDMRPPTAGGQPPPNGAPSNGSS